MLPIKDSTRSSSTINPVTTENMEDTLDTAPSPNCLLVITIASTVAIILCVQPIRKEIGTKVSL